MENLRYIVKEKEIRYFEFGKEIIEKQILILQEYTDENGITIELPSCLNKFMIRWKNTSINNAKNFATTICSFLNFVRMQTAKADDELFAELKYKGIFGLTYYHAANYLNYCITIHNTKYSTIKQYERRILLFYKYLFQNGILTQSDVYLDDPNIKLRNPFTSNMYAVYYPEKTNVKLTKLVNMERTLWQLFIETSEKFAPDITLGIAFQMFGGLRRGELVNITIDDVNTEKIDDDKIMSLLIQNNFLLLFKNRPEIDLSKCQVKRPRKQIVFNFNDKLYDYYENHLHFRNKILKNKRSKTNALFVDENGQAMSGTRYEQRWAKVKKEFLKILEENSYGNYLRMTKYVWGSHIGRGIFTNLCLIHKLAKDARELANLRGDKNLESAQAYLDEFQHIPQINSAEDYIGEEKWKK